MARYRLLTSEELEQFEKEFIDFLVVNGIDADEWNSMKSGQVDEVHRIIDLFSDVVFEKILRNTKYLIFSNHSKLYSFYYSEKKAKLFIADFGEMKLSKSLSEIEILEIVERNQDNLHLDFQEKEYKLTRELEIFKMLQSSCMITKGDIFALFEKLERRLRIKAE